MPAASRYGEESAGALVLPRPRHGRLGRGVRVLAPVSHLRSSIAAAVVALHACETAVAPEVPAPNSASVGVARAALTAEPEPRLVVRVQTAAGEWPAVAELAGAWLDTGAGGRWLAVESWTTEPDRFVAQCAGPADHDVRITVANTGTSHVYVEVEDRIGVRVSLVELGAGWRLLGTGPADEVAVPLLQATEQGVAGDAAFRAPIAFLRSATRAVAVLPDLDALEDWRRIPQGIRVTPATDGGTILHSVVAQQLSASLHAARIEKAPGPGIRVRDEVVRIAHDLHVAADARQGKTLAGLQATLWRDVVAPLLDRSARPFVDESWDRLVPEAIKARFARDLRATPDGDATAFLAAPEGSTDGLLVARLGVRHNQLRDALVALRLGARRDVPELREAALALARFATLAPRRGGLTPHTFRLRVEDGHVEWLPGDPQGPRPDAFDAADSAATVVLLMELAGALEEIEPDVRRHAESLARLLIASQRADGAIPGVYESRHLTPIALDEAALAGATAGPAWFLARYAAWADDEAAREAARRAVAFIGNRVVVEGGPMIDPSLFRSWPRDPITHAPVRDLVPLATATLAAIALADQEPGFGPTAEALADALAALQQVWVPPWSDARLLGGFGGSNADATWNAPGQALAADAMLSAYVLLGRLDLLQRGATALRACLVEPAPFVADGFPRPDAVAAATAGAAVAERCRERLGQAVIDLDRNFAVGVDAVWFEGFVRTTDRVRFRLLTHTPSLANVTVTVRTGARTPPQLVHDEVAVAPDASGRVRLAPDVVPMLVFRPPPKVPAPGAWWPEAAYVGPAPREGSVFVEIRQKGQHLHTVPLRDATTGRLVTAEDPFRIALPGDGQRLQVRLVHDDGRRQVTVPADGFFEIDVGPMASIDPGDDLESTLIDSGPGTRVTRFVDGRENAREAQAGASFGYAVPVPRDAAAIELRILASGPLAISSGPDGRPLYADQEAVPPGDRVITLRLADPRLWPDGELELRFRPTGASAAVARIEYRTIGTSERAELGPTRDLANPDVHLDLLVLPVALAGQPAPDAELLRQALVGGPEYRLTPEPVPQPTVGSLARWIGEISGGRTQVRAEVLEPWGFEATAAELAQEGGWQRLVAAASTRLTAPLHARPQPFDAILLVHSGAPLPLADDLVLETVPVVALPEREPDGSYLSTGRVAHETLERTSGLIPLDQPANGAFGDLALTAKTRGHAPAPPAGINLVRTGWAGIVDVGPQDSERIMRLPLLLEGRTVLRATSGGLPGAGALFLETRSNGATARAGLLVYRQFAPEDAPILRTLDGATVQPRVWRLSPAEPSLQTPFRPATRADLFHDITRLDDRGLPSLTTPRGETPWTIERVEIVEGGSANLRFRWHGTDVLATPRRSWLTGIGTALGPLAEGISGALPGRVTATPRGPLLTLAALDDATLAVMFHGVPTDARQRVFARFEDLDGGVAEVRIGVGGRVLAHALLTDPTTAIVADLPPDPAHRLDITLVRVSGAPTVRLAGLSMVPLSASAVPVLLPNVPAATVRTMDGVVRGGTRTMHLGARGVARLRMPVLLPATHGVLRLAFATDHHVEGTVRLAVELRDADGGAPRIVHEGIEAHGSATLDVPLVVALCELPAHGEQRLAFLDLVATGAPGGCVHVVIAEIDRL